jgi:hypothetical protein
VKKTRNAENEGVESSKQMKFANLQSNILGNEDDKKPLMNDQELEKTNKGKDEMKAKQASASRLFVKNSTKINTY